MYESGRQEIEPVIYKGATHGFMREGELPTASPENKKARGRRLARLENTAFQARIVVVNGDR